MKSGEETQAYILAQNIKRRRAELRLNQLQLAEKSKLSVVTIKQVETRKRWPRPETLEALAAALETSPSDLLSRADPNVEKAPQSPNDEGLFKKWVDLWFKATPEQRETMVSIAEKTVQRGVGGLSKAEGNDV